MEPWTNPLTRIKIKKITHNKTQKIKLHEGLAADLAASKLLSAPWFQFQLSICATSLKGWVRFQTPPPAIQPPTTVCANCTQVVLLEGAPDLVSPSTVQTHIKYVSRLTFSNELLASLMTPRKGREVGDTEKEASPHCSPKRPHCWLPELLPGPRCCCCSARPQGGYRRPALLTKVKTRMPDYRCHSQWHPRVWAVSSNSLNSLLCSVSCHLPGPTPTLYTQARFLSVLFTDKPKHLEECLAPRALSTQLLNEWYNKDIPEDLLIKELNLSGTTCPDPSWKHWTRSFSSPVPMPDSLTILTRVRAFCLIHLIRSVPDGCIALLTLGRTGRVGTQKTMMGQPDQAPRQTEQSGVV